MSSAGCGDSDATVDIVPASLDFGETDCGTTAIPQVEHELNRRAWCQRVGHRE